MADKRFDDLIDAAQRKYAAGEVPMKDEANAYWAGGLFNPTHQVYFRAGLIACREYMARFVEAQSPEIAGSIRANWWPKLGPDFGPPRQMRWDELTEGEYETDDFKVKEGISPTLEALPIALHFLLAPEPASPTAATQPDDGGKTNAVVEKCEFPLCAVHHICDRKCVRNVGVPSCHHRDTVWQQTGDGTPVVFCRECGRNISVGTPGVRADDGGKQG